VPHLTFLSPLTNVLYTAVSWVLLRWHQLFTALGMDPNGGFTWALSIVFLVITARVLLFRFFIKQVHYTRQMQKLAPEIAKLKEKHKGDRQAQQQAMMQLQQDQGLNMLAGCLPMFLQIPVFISLFHVLRHLANSAHAPSGSSRLTLYGFSEGETKSAATATLFGKAPLASSFHDSAAKVASLGGNLNDLRTVTIVLAVISAAATFLTQKQVQRNATTAPTGQAASIQKIMLYFIPLSVLVSGIIFPLGVLFYWFTSNLWTMGQQFYIYRYHPVDDDAEAVAAIAGPSRALAPRPGAKPVTRDRRTGSTASAVPSAAGAAGSVPVSTEAVDTAGSRPNANRAGTSKPGAPRAGQRPNGAKPPQKRSAQKRKRR
jgi:YidC/Oxa1 family membrane protein insertase